MAQQSHTPYCWRLPCRRSSRLQTPNDHQIANPIVKFSLGFFFFIDASAFSHSSQNGSEIHIKFVDWIPLICSSLGMLVINSIEKARLSADSYSYSGTGVAWKARLVLFLGFALMAGGLAGSVVGSHHWLVKRCEG